MKLPITTWVVMIHHQDVGTFAPAFSTMDEAEEFSNAIKMIINDSAVSEPVPIVPTQSLRFDTKGNLVGELN